MTKSMKKKRTAILIIVLAIIAIAITTYMLTRPSETQDKYTSPLDTQEITTVTSDNPAGGGPSPQNI
jgi:hypothetical protein